MFHHLLFSPYFDSFRFQGDRESQQKKKRKAFFVSVPVHDQIKDILESKYKFQ